ncbi:SDR family oxidoreductase [Coleofasciculus sp. FACHB-64]|uniref:SDR family NAD(P)-dependent oxidoreductase n=1 Tax=Cyanophyceae TaxID=3028117 RepID=UPI0016887E4C|nr:MULTISPECIES: SDR family oxidoreductase [unclassified Coleofasciculus]MBD1881410.1 SDR family oxidoreductase [Coleofasciculus sp. FACHB-T130]MBD1891136.1 SDR family oxidoreductase [Coleofasciculus sp. FACHB-SPT9]MBD1896162.1 SDR family oxidoreductase [Coleofasciculus sp. FACHB-129]MBD1941837.1 SDR family oxidoreductase [Coleofasciculus sp. FACHB-712]MBD2046520.1 SDR family oxidoreductase [Coleofasciculus sp. FACHB-64]
MKIDTPPLSEQVILITGASTGIGAALAQVLATQSLGIRLVLAARNQEKLEEVATFCRKAGADVLVVPTDISQVEQAKALATKTIDHFGRVDALVNNAGYGQMGPVELIPFEAVQRQFQVNLLGPLALIQALIPGMRDQGGGRIVNISSLGGRLAFPFGGLYSSSKFALEGISDALRMELAPFNIKVSVIEPGPVSTEFFAVAAQRVEQAISTPQDTPYRAAFERLEGLEERTSSRAWTSERVAKVVVRSLTDRHPRPRYVAATGGDILLFLMNKVLPTRAVDAFWQRFYGIDKVAKDWQSRQKQG